MTIQTRTTELEAVNTILSTIGEAPLNTLSGSLPVDGTIAKNVLSEVAREVQSEGFHFNTHYKVTLSRDTDNKIPLATNVVRVELDPNKQSKSSYDIVQRDGFLYNLAKNMGTSVQQIEWHYGHINTKKIVGDLTKGGSLKDTQKAKDIELAAEMINHLREGTPDEKAVAAALKNIAINE